MLTSSLSHHDNTSHSCSTKGEVKGYSDGVATILLKVGDGVGIRESIQDGHLRWNWASTRASIHGGDVCPSHRAL